MPKPTPFSRAAKAIDRLLRHDTPEGNALFAARQELSRDPLNPEAHVIIDALCALVNRTRLEAEHLGMVAQHALQQPDFGDDYPRDDYDPHTLWPDKGA